MPRELLILRHAKSDWNTDSPNDFARPLAKRGKKDAPQVGAWLYREGLIPDWVVSSPAKRAKETARQVCKSLEFKPKRIAWEPALYGADVPTLLKVLADCPSEAEIVLLIGHNPGLEELLRFLADEEVETPPDGKLLPTAALARLEMPKDWRNLEPGCAQLLHIHRPRAPRIK